MQDQNSCFASSFGKVSFTSFQFDHLSVEGHSSPHGYDIHFTMDKYYQIMAITDVSLKTQRCDPRLETRRLSHIRGDHLPRTSGQLLGRCEASHPRRHPSG